MGSQGRNNGLEGICGEVIYNRYSEVISKCIIIHKVINILPLNNFGSKDLMVQKFKTTSRGEPGLELDQRIHGYRRVNENLAAMTTDTTKPGE